MDVWRTSKPLGNFCASFFAISVPRSALTTTTLPEDIHFERRVTRTFPQYPLSRRADFHHLSRREQARILGGLNSCALPTTVREDTHLGRGDPRTVPRYPLSRRADFLHLSRTEKARRLGGLNSCALQHKITTPSSLGQRANHLTLRMISSSINSKISRIHVNETAPFEWLQ